MPLASGELLTWGWRLGGILVGGGGGYLYYRLIGCKTGGCPITGNPWISTIYGAILGALLVAH